ncbi:MAG: shikimate dehydrogenase [Bauldia sp.]|nr:shikimate dehydrogenase [Bauldia sp.]
MSGPVACVVGWPIAHSRSPAIHRHWLKTYGIAGDYVAKPVPPPEAAAFFAGFAQSGFVGGNVTVPHKEAAFAAATDHDEAAAALGAVNTLWLEDGELHGGNTDGYGFLANLDENAPGWDWPGLAVVLGAGGAARAVIWSLVGRGFDPVIVVNRTVERAEALAERFGPTVRAAGWDAVPGALAEAQILVNTTSLGMTGQPPLDLDLTPLPDEAVVNDLVYVPLETGLLAAARRRELTAVDGLGMLLHQAAPGFERWFGQRPEVTPELRAIVVADLEQHR